MTEVVIPSPRITVSTEIAVKETKQIITAQYQLDPKDIERSIMDDIEKLVGNAQARVTVSADFGIKDFGTGASAMCSVSLTCNQDVKTLEEAAKLAGDMARDFAQEQRQRAENELQAILQQRQNMQSGGPTYR